MYQTNQLIACSNTFPPFFPFFKILEKLWWYLNTGHDRVRYLSFFSFMNGMRMISPQSRQVMTTLLFFVRTLQFVP
jgi:hypothetical protein